MGYRNIMISSPISIRVKNKQLMIEKDEEICIPLEDINSILFEKLTIQVSIYFLQKMAEFGIVVYTCDEKHMPNGVFLPLLRHSRHFKMLKSQINLRKPLKNRLWQQLIVQKILNQAKCLELCSKDGFKELEKFSREVQSGDKTHVEAKAAAFYFRRLYGDSFYRDDDHVINSALNYGYAIIRGQIARSVVCYGFECSIGLFHHSEQNSFNLVDDFIEPYRSFVDLFVYQNYHDREPDAALTSQMKKELFTLTNLDLKMEEKNNLLSNSIDKMIGSFSSCLIGSKESLILPELIPIQVHRYE